MSDHPDPSRLWRQRRRMAWLSLSVLLIAAPALLWLLPADTLAEVQGLIRFWLGCLLLVVLAYVANCAVESGLSIWKGGPPR